MADEKLTPAQLPSKLPFNGAGADQVKVGGSLVGQRLQGKNVLDPSASIQSPDFVAGSAGFQLNGDGTAEFNDITVRGTIIGTFKTATSGNRIEIQAAAAGVMKMFSGYASETAPGLLGEDSPGSYARMQMTNSTYGTAGDVAQTIAMTEPSAGRRAITIEGGKPNGGSRGWVYIQPSGSPEGRVMIREGGPAPFKNLGTTPAGTTLVGGALPNTEAAPLPYQIGSTESMTTDGTGVGTITLPSSGFANGILACTATAVTGVGAGILLTLHGGTTKTVLKFGAWDVAAGAVYTGTFDVSYVAVGW